MLKTEFKIQYETVCDKTDTLPVIIVAAGKSSRMKGENKQFSTLLGMPVIARTLSVFQNSPFISKIILVTSSENILPMQKIADEYGIDKLTDITCGGEDRFSSVLKGMKKLSLTDKKVLIHDGARPLVTDFIIGNVTAALQNNTAAVCAVAVKDTIKEANSDGFVIKTPDRSRLYSVQTPQGVEVELYKKAAEKIVDTSSVTDDASVMESAGYAVKIVKGDYSNIKITTPEDIVLAEALLNYRNKE